MGEGESEAIWRNVDVPFFFAFLFFSLDLPSRFFSLYPVKSLQKWAGSPVSSAATPGSS